MDHCRPVQSRQRRELVQRTPTESPQIRRRVKCSDRELEKLVSQLNDVSECLQRTQHECEAIARRCGEKEKGARQSRESGSTEPEYTSEDLHVERLLLLAQSVLRQQQKSPSPPATAVSWQPAPRELMGGGEGVDGGGRRELPDSPADISVQPNLSGGAYVLWTPVRLDAQDKNNAHRVTGYAVYVNGVLRSKVEDPIRTHSDIVGMENGMDYQVQVSTLAEDCASPLSLPLLYRHTSRPPQQGAVGQRQAHSTKVEKWLRHSQTATICQDHDGPLATPPLQDVNNKAESSSGAMTPSGHARLCKESTHFHKDHAHISASHTHLPDDARSVGSSHTSGIVMDLAPFSPKMTATTCLCRQCSLQSESTVMIGSQTLSNKDSASSGHHHRHHCHHPHPFTPSPSPISRGYSPDNALDDNSIDEPLEFSMVAPPTCATPPLDEVPSILRAVQGQHKGPAAPENVRVKCRQPGYVTVSWTPAKRDDKGCSNGYFILGYRVYIKGSSQMSVDGPMKHEATLRCPPSDANHKLMVHMRTRSIAAESSPSITVVYDLLLQESLSRSESSSLSSSSSTTLCPADMPHPPLHRGKSPTANMLTVETYV